MVSARSDFQSSTGTLRPSGDVMKDDTFTVYRNRTLGACSIWASMDARSQLMLSVLSFNPDE